ncbi:MAG: hypothetical protein CL537_05895 [Alcanivoracaceae bacterium]|nr:hypothetical protein [Alcanivoracaceae bacterium]MCG8439890.1 hypothetical protein [Pseudomonadales bacterium]|tara:strand:+ start:3063 stop:3740 length:678 start_codon:yes stop_codon:yes gene_type:complete
MKKNVIALSVVAAMALPGAALADQKDGENVDSTAKVQASPAMDALSLAAGLEALGRDKKDALLLAAALRLQQSVATENASREKTVQGDADESADKPGQVALAELAKEYAGDNEALLSVVAMAGDTVASRGAHYGAIGHEDRVYARTTDVYDITFTGGRQAEILVRGDGDTDLDLYIYDEYGNEICSDTLRDDRPYCVWNPRWTGEFSVHVKNLGGVYNNYVLLTN